MSERPISEAARMLLTRIRNDGMGGGYPRPTKSPERDELQRRGLIETRKPSPLALRYKPYWALTEAGRAELEGA